MTQVLLFARARELAGVRSIELPGSTVAEVLDFAATRFGPEFDAVCRTCTVVVDGETVPRSEAATTSAGEELAILPPVSGGSHDPAADERGLRVVVVTVSDRASAGEYDDLTGPAIEELLSDRLAAQIVGRALVPDEMATISATIRGWCDDGGCDLVVTNGGTGLSRRDLTPEATRQVLDVELPGLPELMRAAGVASTPLAALSRQVAGRRGTTLVVNVPGSVRGALESLEAVLDVLPHAVAVARSEP